MRASRRSVVALSLMAVLATACATEPASTPSGTERGRASAEVQSVPGRAEMHDGFAVSIDGPTIELRQGDGEHVHRWTVGDNDPFQTFLVHPDSTAGMVDVVVLALAGERPVLYRVYARPNAENAIAEFPEHLQPIHEVEADLPVFAWTPDGRSLVWTEPAGDAMVLRAVGWQDGPGTGRAADDNVSFVLDVPRGAHVEGFAVHSESEWTLLLRDGASTDPIEVSVARRVDGALAIPASR